MPGGDLGHEEGLVGVEPDRDAGRVADDVVAEDPGRRAEGLVLLAPAGAGLEGVEPAAAGGQPEGGIAEACGRREEERREAEGEGFVRGDLREVECEVDDFSGATALEAAHDWATLRFRHQHGAPVRGVENRGQAECPVIEPVAREDGSRGDLGVEGEDEADGVGSGGPSVQGEKGQLERARTGNDPPLEVRCPCLEIVDEHVSPAAGPAVDHFGVMPSAIGQELDSDRIPRPEQIRRGLLLSLCVPTQEG